MNFSYLDLVSIEEILSDVLRSVDDEQLRLRTKGFYIRKIKEGLEKLAYRTYFDKRFIDIPFPSNLKVDLPSGAWNIRDMFLFDKPECDPENPEETECCEVTNMTRVFYKANYITTGVNKSYTARNKADNRDLFIRKFSNDSDLCYYNVQNGMIMFSEYCKNWNTVRIEYNGMAKDVDKSKIVPPFAAEAVSKYVITETFLSLKSQDPKYRVLWIDAKADLYTPKGRLEASVWDEAKYLLKTMDRKQRDDIAEYHSKMNY